MYLGYIARGKTLQSEVKKVLVCKSLPGREDDAFDVRPHMVVM